MKPSFVGRETELQLLDRLWARPEATLLILYGRRRVGKTRLLTYWLRQGDAGEAGQEQAARRVLYWVAEPSSARDQLRSFSQAVYNFANPQAPAPEDFTYASWQQAWQQVAALAQVERLGLLLDEFTYLLEIDPSIAGQMQNLWDQTLSRSNLFLVICGSHLGMMLRHTLSYQAPLYGRATAQLRLQPLPFGMTARYFTRFDADERVAIYAIWGGIPAYWERLDPAATLSDNIRHELLTANNLMQAEPRLLLQDFVNEPHNYVGILRAIANDARTQGEIAAFSGLAQGHVSQYLSILQDAGFVERRVPVTQGERARLGRYHIVDPYLRFYYRFLASRQSQLALGIQEQSLAEIKRHLRDFIGANTWEELCREWLLRAERAASCARAGGSGGQRLDAAARRAGGCGGHQLDGEDAGAGRVQVGARTQWAQCPDRAGRKDGGGRAQPGPMAGLLSGVCPGRLDPCQPRVRPGSQQRAPDRQELAGVRHATAGFDAS